MRRQSMTKAAGACPAECIGRIAATDYSTVTTGRRPQNETRPPPHPLALRVLQMTYAIEPEHVDRLNKRLAEKKSQIETLTREKSALEVEAQHWHHLANQRQIRLAETIARAEAAEKLVADAAEVIRPFLMLREWVSTWNAGERKNDAQSYFIGYERDAARAWTDKHDKHDKGEK